MSTVKQGPFSTFDQAVAAEFFAPSASGAYASSTVCGANTRRYHAILAAPVSPAAGTYIFLNSLEEVVSVGGARHFLSTHEYPGAIYPQGFRHLVSFEMDPLPVFEYELHGLRLSRTIAVAPAERTVVVAYELLSGPPSVSFDVRPLSSFRSRHLLSKTDPSMIASVQSDGAFISFRPQDSLPALRMSFPGDFHPEAYWYKTLVYRRDRERGHDYMEDLVSPGFFRTTLELGKPAYFVATVEDKTGSPAALLAAAEASALEWAKPARRFPPFASRLAAGFRAFIIQDSSQTDVLRGQPWHTRWARNAFLALPGFLALGQLIEAESILETWARRAAGVDAGRAAGSVLPRYMDDQARPGPSDALASLWFFEAIENLLAYTKNYEFVKARLMPFMTAFLDLVSSGSCPQARLRDDGLLYTQGSARTLAPRDDGWYAFVEVQALYFNALKCMESIAAHFRDDASTRRWHDLAKTHQRAFNKLMWDAYNHVAIDCYSESGLDRTPRPMSLFAISLSHPVLIRRRWEILVDQVENALLTPLGLLAVPQDYPGSRQIFPGDSFEDARRSGGIWPEFLGAFLVAHAKTFGRSSSHHESFAKYLRPLEDNLSTGMLQHLPEFFDSTEPSAARGAPSNAAASGQLIWALTTKVDPRHYEHD